MIMSSRLGWRIANRTLGSAYRALTSARERALTRRLVDRICDNGKVLSGPFAGMKYARQESHGSVLIPKYLGAYEAELHPTLEAWRSIPFDVVVDVGSAEGYYAVGLALRYPNAKIVAFDIAERARELTRDLAEANGVSDRLQIKSECSQQELLRLQPSDERFLIVSDCEGWEGELFSREVLEHLAGCHLIIEVHDRPRKKIDIFNKLHPRISQTHCVELIHCCSDKFKPEQYESSYVGSDPLERQLAFREQRPDHMCWIVATPSDTRNA